MKKEGTFGVEQIIQVNIPKISFFFARSLGLPKTCQVKIPQ